MTASDRFKSVSIATLWTLLDYALGRGLSIFFIAVLARVLTPYDFGTFALLAIFLGVSTALIESGFGLALIQRQDTNDDDNSTVFWVNLLVATLIALCLIFAAPVFASFFENDQLVPLTYIMALNVWVVSFGIVQRALMVKQLEFKKLAVVNLSALSISSTFAIYLAMSEFGVFTLAWQGLISALVTSVLLWLLNSWRPRLILSVTRAKSLFGFGGFMLASKLLDVIYSKTYTILIGKVYGPGELGHFNRAESISQLVTGLVVHPISQIAFSVFSKMESDPSRMRSGLRGAVRASMTINAVIVFTLAATSRPVVLTLLGPQWEDSVSTLQVLSMNALLMPLHMLNLQALMALGRSEKLFLLEVIKKVIGTMILIITSHYGAFGIAWGLVFGSLISFFVNAWYSGLYLNYGAFRQLIDIIPSVLMGLFAAASAKVLIEFFEVQSSFLQLLIGLSGALISTSAIVAIAAVFRYDFTGLQSYIEEFRVWKYKGV